MKYYSLLFAIVFLTSCQPSKLPTPKTPPNSVQNINVNNGKFFGYYASQMDGIAATSDIDELVGKSNFVFIHSGEMQAKLQKCRELGMKAMVSFSWLTFTPQNRLYPDWQERVKWATDIMDQYQDVIIANYILDEPFMNGADDGVSVNDMYNYLETLGQFFKAKYPQMPIAVIYSTRELKNGFKTPPSFDWFGMDCYGSFVWCDKNSVPGHYNIIKAEIKKLEDVDHKPRYLMAVPPAGYEAKDPANEQSHFDQLVNYRSFIKSEPKMKIVIPFLWQTFTNNSESWIGARDTKFKNDYVKFYQDFMTDNL